MPNLEKRVEGRFGVLPNFFRLAPETPEITEKLWRFAEPAYPDNPLPSVSKERLFVHLSRFCAVRYCIARHVGFLVGLGRPADDSTVRTQTVTDVIKLLRRPFPCGQELQSRLSLCAGCPAPIAEMPMADTQMEDAIFVLAGHVFLKTSDYLLCLEGTCIVTLGVRPRPPGWLAKPIRSLSRLRIRVAECPRKSWLRFSPRVPEWDQ